MKDAHSKQDQCHSVLKRVIQSARSFTDRHRAEPAIALTYRYFTRHPFARLNQMRLGVLLENADRESEKLGRPLRILDLACGGGMMTCAFASLGHRSLGIDLSPAEIRMARLFAQEERLDGMFLHADLINEPQWERIAENTLGGKPDLICLAYALHHLPEVTPLLKRLSRWLEPGSVLLINEENPLSPMFRLKHRVRGWIQHDTETEWHRSYPEWKRLIEPQGFTFCPPLQGLDLVPGLARVKPDRCWSIVFTAQRS